MDSKQRELGFKIINLQIDIEKWYGIPQRIKDQYGEDELDEQMMADIQEVVSEHVSALSRMQQKTIHEYDIHVPGAEDGKGISDRKTTQDTS